MDWKRLQDSLERAIASPASPPTELLPDELGDLVRAMSCASGQTANDIADCLSGDPACANLAGKMLNCGFGAFRQVSLETIRLWMVDYAARRGAQQAVKALKWFLEADKMPATYVVALRYLEVDHAVDLADGRARLVPFAALPDSNAKRAFDPQLPENRTRIGQGGPAYQLFVAPPVAALVVPTVLEPKVVSPGEETKVDLTDITFIDDIVDSMALAGGLAPLVLGSWVDIDESVPLTGPLFGTDYGTFAQAVGQITFSVVTSFEASDLSRVCDGFLACADDVRHALRVPLKRLNQARHRAYPVDRAIDLGIAFEAIYLHDRVEPGQLSLAFRLRGAWHHGTTAEERRSFFERFRAIYRCRSSAVHDGTLSDEVKVDGKSMLTTQFLNDADRLCEKSIQRIVDAGALPDWDRMVLGS